MTDTEAKIFAQTGSADWSKSAYMLVYEKKLKSELISNPNFRKSL